MAERHSLLKRQIQRHLAGRERPELAEFLRAVDDAYRQSDEDRLMLERSFELCSTELLQANAGLREAKDAAEAANLAKRRFLASMSHELRTPLYAIVGYGELVESEVRERGLDELASEVASIRRAGRHLMDLINDLLDFAKIEAGRMDLRVQDFDADVLLDELVALARPLADDNGNRLTLDRPRPLGVISADPTKVRQILLNLLSNANKFTVRGRIVLAASREDDVTVLFRVRDTGPGIPPEQQHLLFQPFTQLSAGGAKLPGTGLGLAITRQHCESMGGRIEVQSAPGQGSVFSVRLPVRVACAA